MVGCVLFAFILWGSWYRDAAFDLPSLSASACIWRLPPTSCTMGKMVDKTQKSTPLSTGEKFLFWAIFILIPIYPIYWLISQPILLTIFCAASNRVPFQSSHGHRNRSDAMRMPPWERRNYLFKRTKAGIFVSSGRFFYNTYSRTDAIPNQGFRNSNKTRQSGSSK
jgi:hypothetical protein